MVAREKIYTAGDLWELSQLPAYEGKRLELIDGEIIEMPPTGGEHGSVTHEMALDVGLFVRQHQLGYVTAAETGYILGMDADGKETVQAPDIGFITFARLPDGLPAGYIPYPPDLAVETVSPNDRADVIDRKTQAYLRAGTRLVWLVYPKTRSLMIHRPSSTERLMIDDVLSGEDVLPGFTLPIRQIFARLK